jgi:hypothetical protein
MNKILRFLISMTAGILALYGLIQAILQQNIFINLIIIIVSILIYYQVNFKNNNSQKEILYSLSNLPRERPTIAQFKVKKNLEMLRITIVICSILLISELFIFFLEGLNLSFHVIFILSLPVIAGMLLNFIYYGFDTEYLLLTDQYIASYSHLLTIFSKSRHRELYFYNYRLPYSEIGGYSIKQNNLLFWTKDCLSDYQNIPENAEFNHIYEILDEKITPLEKFLKEKLSLKKLPWPIEVA